MIRRQISDVERMTGDIQRYDKILQEPMAGKERTRVVRCKVLKGVECIDMIGTAIEHPTAVRVSIRSAHQINRISKDTLTEPQRILHLMATIDLTCA